MFIGLGLGLRNIGNSSNGAARLLGNEAQGMAIDFRDMTMLIRDTTTPANNFNGDPNTKLAYTSPSTKNILLGTGVYGGGTTLRTEYNSSLAALGTKIEPASTWLALWNRDFTNAAWTKSNMTAAKTATGVTGVANSASTLTATAGNATVLQSITSGSSARITGCRIKRRTGSGAVELTQNNGTNWTAVTVTSDWTRVEIPSATLTNPTVGIRVVTSGDAVDVDFFGHETGAVLTSDIEVSGSTVTRAADNVTIATSLFPYNQPEGTLVVAGIQPVLQVNGRLAELSNGTANRVADMLMVAGPNVQVFNGTGTLTSTNGVTAGNTIRAAIAYKTADYALSMNGAAVVTRSDALVTTATNLRIGSFNSGALQLNGWIQSVLYVPRRVSNSDLLNFGA